MIRMLRSLVLGALFVFAMQAKSQAQVSIGLRCGVNASRFYGNNLNVSSQGNGLAFTREANSIAGREIGAIVTIPLSRKHLALQAEINYAQAGSSIEESATYDLGSRQSTSQYKYRFIQVPVMVRLSTHGSFFRIFALAGPYLAYANSGDLQYESYLDPGTGLANYSSSSRSIDFKSDSLRQFDFGLQAGGGAMVRLGPVWLGVDARYKAGFNNSSYSNYSKTNDIGSKHTAYSGSVFLLIPFRKRS
jgi:hypothetical protein